MMQYGQKVKIKLQCYLEIRQPIMKKLLQKSNKKNVARKINKDRY